MDEVGRDDVHQQPPLGVGLAHQPNVAEAQVAQAAVDQLRRGARRAAAEVPAVDQGDSEPVGSGELGDTGPDDPAADHEQVVSPLAQLRERALARS